MIVATLEEVVEDLKLELWVRSAARELAVEIEAKDRRRGGAEMAHELSEGRAEAIREATSRLADRLEKAEKAVERERGARVADVKRAKSFVCWRRSWSGDGRRIPISRRKGAAVKEANANAEAFKNKLSRLEQEMVDVKMSEENAREELKRQDGDRSGLTRRFEEVSKRALGTTTARTDARTASKLVAGSSPSSRVPSEEYAGPKRPALETE